MASDVPYKAICALNAATCSIGSEHPSYASNIGSRKCSGMGLSWISASLLWPGPGWRAPAKPYRSPLNFRGWVQAGVSQGSLNRRQYLAGVWTTGFPSPNKGKEPPRVSI
ncbi:hypothetical protein B296_00029842 [Ensete ventricosum]|uniref:Uncharacterized protein n=1 Tax=Ensete ventricosum TaxID=4639 RepID=A0A426YWT3_ENSVE|nr:hypothetical protein B296_00029842 [Ensete ventricosum]